LRDQLKAGLSGTAQEPGKEDGRSVSVLAERIKAIKAANTIEATPQRDRQKHTSAEEPIAARIRRRMEAVAASDQVIQPDAAAPGPVTSTPPESTAQAVPEDNADTTRDASIKPQMTFQVRIAIERRQKEREPRLS
jgi:hypothetical protein